MTHMTQPPDRPEPSCYNCSHHIVCRYSFRSQPAFPYKDDPAIEDLLPVINTALAKACAHYDLNPLEML